jgi:hypothetical protein
VFRIFDKQIRKYVILFRGFVGLSRQSPYFIREEAICDNCGRLAFCLVKPIQEGKPEVIFCRSPDRELLAISIDRALLDNASCGPGGMDDAALDVVTHL